MRFALALLPPLLAACPPPPDTDDTEVPVDTDVQPPVVLGIQPRTVRVALDGVPVEGAMVVQGGIDALYPTGPDGRVEVPVDFDLYGEIIVHASHPEARIRSQQLRPGETDEVTLDLERVPEGDNPEYTFQDPGTPTINDTTNYCSHCHVTINESWYDSPHRTSASNPHVQDVYAGVSHTLTDAAACAEAGGTWQTGIGPGTAAPAERCYLGVGTLPDLNPACAPNCDTDATHYGGCADCHAPGIDGALGGRDLLQAAGFAHDYGVHCDVCHKVERVDVDNPDPGVAGRLVIQRPTELAATPIAGPWLPLQFGPHHDVSNPRMGSVQRDHYRDGSLCAGCHQLDQAAVMPGSQLDPERWPEGTLPVQSTYVEWQEGPFGGTVPCNACHMPPNPAALNGADLQLVDIPPGLPGGWVRPPGSVRHHSWVGPRTASSRMLQLAAAVDVDVTAEADLLVATVRTSNVGAGHRIPTGEPGRTLILRVQATCDGAPLAPVGGDVVPDFVGALDRRDASEDLSRWPGAAVGDTLRVLRDAGPLDYAGFGPFGDGTFDAAAKGLTRWQLVGVRTVTAVSDEVVTLDAPLPVGNVVLRGPALALPAPDQDAAPDAGFPGFAFARVLTDASGRPGVPHHAAVDVRADNRLAPYQSFTTSHRFAGGCAEPVVTARLSWRRHPAWLAAEKHWSNPEAIMVEVQR